jgi:hypothetical protein
MDHAHSFFTSPQNDGAKHSMLVKQTPRRDGLFSADISDIPAAATIVSATLHLHIESDEGLANSDTSSVLADHVCDRPRATRTARSRWAWWSRPRWGPIQLESAHVAETLDPATGGR